MTAGHGKPLVKKYATDEIVVEWEPRLCFHSGTARTCRRKCSTATAGPWVSPDEASADEIELTVDQCPSGALRTKAA